MALKPESERSLIYGIFYTPGINRQIEAFNGGVQTDSIFSALLRFYLTLTDFGRVILTEVL